MTPRCNPSPELDARVDCPVLLPIPSDGTNYRTSKPSPPTKKNNAPLGFTELNLNGVLPVDSMGSAAHHWCGGESRHPPKKSGAPWNV